MRAEESVNSCSCLVFFEESTNGLGVSSLNEVGAWLWLIVGGAQVWWRTVSTAGTAIVQRATRLAPTSAPSTPVVSLLIFGIP